MNQRQTDRLTFYFDPLCPWAWVTSIWARNVRDQGCITIDWKFFSLAAINEDEELRFAPLRVCALARAEGGNEAVEKAYVTLGTMIHGHGKRVRDAHDFEEDATAALSEAGYPPDFVHRALNDPSTLEEVQKEHKDAVDRLGAFGVPWLVLGNQEYGFFGPVINDFVDGSQAIDLWNHMRWVLTQDYLFELKRGRASLPPLKV